MRCSARTQRLAGLVVGIVCLSAAGSRAGGQEFVTGAAAQAWEKWQAAMQAVVGRDADTIETAFGELLQAEPAAFRLALMAQRTVMRGNLGGAVVLFEQDAAADALGADGKRVSQALDAGREQMNEADDGWFFASVGQFEIADANFKALLASNPDPVALLEFADRVRRRHDVLLLLADNPVVGQSALEIQKLLLAGERMVKADPTRIKEHIDRLGGPPRMVRNSVARLIESGEHAIPFLVQYLRDAEKKQLVPAIVRALPRIDRGALNPSVVALRMDDQATKRFLIEALGKIGYAQALPYLLQLRENSATPPEIQAAVQGALEGLRARGAAIGEYTAAEAFFALAEAYYRDDGSLAADPRLDTANVWYWRDKVIQNVEVPTVIFNEIMSMRCCEESLRLDPNLKPAVALWLAANFRREAQLPADQTDWTRPDKYPAASYFAQSAGADHCLAALRRAVADGDPAVALGLIEALRRTAGTASIIGGYGGGHPLAEALSFPDRMVRIRAALALANARPRDEFHNYQNLTPVLAEALNLHAGARHALVVDPDERSANVIMTVLRSDGYDVISDAALFPGLEKVRKDLPGVDVIFVASDVKDPGLAEGLAQLRSEFRFGSTPVILIVKPGDRQLAGNLARADHRLGEAAATDDPERIKTTIANVSRAVGANPITPAVGLSLALETAEVLRGLAESNNPLFKVEDLEQVLAATLATQDSELRIAVARVLAHIGSAAAQEAIAGIAMDGNESQGMRVAMFGVLAEAAKRRGKHLAPESVQRLIKIAESEENMDIREAAAQALGALNLPSDPASEIIRNQHRG